MTAADVSIVVEWDNVRLAGASRARTMLEGLAEAVRASPVDAEILLVHDGRPGDVAAAQAILAPTGADVRVVSAPGRGYYDLKNAGVLAAGGELVVFLDCDIVIEPGWLQAIVAPFADPRVGVVAGATHVDSTGAWANRLAPVMVFPPRPADGPVEASDRFFANNVAFRRETALAFPFPPVAGSARAACVALAARLAEAGVTVVRNPAARARHPVPQGVRQTVVRALVHGRDTVALAEIGAVPPVTVGAGLRRVGRLLASVVRDRTRLGLRTADVPVAAAVALGYYGLVAVGAAVARVAPSAARRLQL